MPPRVAGHCRIGLRPAIIAMTFGAAAFPPVYVISLARAQERRDSIRARLDKLGAKYEVVDAVDGFALDPAEYEHRLRQDKYRRKFGVDMVPGQIGCYLSHYNLWRRIVDEKIPSALILEDDSDWDDDLETVAEEIDNLDWRWAVVLLSGRKDNAQGRVLATVGDNRRLLLSDRREKTTAGYMVSQWGAALLLEYCREITAPIDISFAEWWRSQIPFYVVSPPPVWQIESESTIQYKKHKKRAPMHDRIIASLWRKYDRLHCKWSYLQTSTSKERGE